VETERLILRAPKPGDEEEFLAIRNSEFVLKYNCMPKVTIEELLEKTTEKMEEGEVFYLELKENGKVIGFIGLNPDTLRYRVNSICISYYLGEDYSRKGYMTEALEEIIRYVFEEKQVDVLSARVFKENIASRRLVEKLGFVNEGCIRRCVKAYQDIIYDDMVYSILREEYEARRK